VYVSRSLLYVTPHLEEDVADGARQHRGVKDNVAANERLI
jgi:hypothetical protein